MVIIDLFLINMFYIFVIGCFTVQRYTFFSKPVQKSLNGVLFWLKKTVTAQPPKMLCSGRHDCILQASRRLTVSKINIK